MKNTHEADGLECLFGLDPGLPLLTDVIDEYVMKREFTATPTTQDASPAPKGTPVNQFTGD